MLENPWGQIIITIIFKCNFIFQILLLIFWPPLIAAAAVAAKKHKKTTFKAQKKSPPRFTRVKSILLKFNRNLSF